MASQIAYNPWQPPSIATSIVGHQSSVNPTGSVPLFRGAQAVDELGVHGTFDTPEHTAQTAPSVVSFCHNMKWAEIYPNITQDELHTSLNCFVEFRMTQNSERWSTAEDFIVRKARAIGGYDEPAAKTLQSGILLTNVDDDDRALISLLPPSNQCKTALFHDRYTSSGDRKLMYGVLMDHLHVASDKKCRTTLAVEHAVEIKLKLGTEAQRSEFFKVSGKAGERVWFLQA